MPAEAIGAGLLLAALVGVAEWRRGAPRRAARLAAAAALGIALALLVDRPMRSEPPVGPRAAALHGLVHVRWPRQVTLGEAFQVRGEVRGDTGWVTLADAAGPVDSVRAGSTFALRATPRSTGIWRYTLTLRGAEAESLGVEVRAPVPPRVLVVEARPDDDLRAAREFFSRAGARIAARVTVSRDRNRTEVSGGARPLDHLDAAALAGADLVLLDSTAAATLPAAERAALLDAVRERGLGVVGLAAPGTMRVALRDARGDSLGVVMTLGAGRIALLDEAAPAAWRRAGDAARFERYWAAVARAVARPASDSTRWQVRSDGPLLVDEPVRVARPARGRAMVVVHGPHGDDTLHAGTAPDSATSATWWPRDAGWHTLGDGADAARVLVQAPGAWRAAATVRRNEWDARRMLRGAPAPAATSPTVPVHRWWAWLLLLLACGYLWAEGDGLLATSASTASIASSASSR